MDSQNIVIYFIFCLFTFLFSILFPFRLFSLISSTSASAQTFCPSEYIIMFPLYHRLLPRYPKKVSKRKGRFQIAGEVGFLFSLWSENLFLRYKLEKRPRSVYCRGTCRMPLNHHCSDLGPPLFIWISIGNFFRDTLSL